MEYKKRRRKSSVKMDINGLPNRFSLRRPRRKSDLQTNQKFKHAKRHSIISSPCYELGYDNGETNSLSFVQESDQNNINGKHSNSDNDHSALGKCPVSPEPPAFPSYKKTLNYRKFQKIFSDPSQPRGQDIQEEGLEQGQPRVGDPQRVPGT